MRLKVEEYDLLKKPQEEAITLRVVLYILMEAPMFSILVFMIQVIKTPQTM